VNRFGKQPRAEIHVVLKGPLLKSLKEADPVVRAAFVVISRLPAVGKNQRDASPKALMNLQNLGSAVNQAFTPAPPIVRLVR
jgi:hypothetical protein